jgi:uncharacterized protein (DUF608 family)
LLILRDYLWTGDRQYLKEMWGHIKAAMDHNLSTDEHGVLLPYHYDRSSTSTYIASQTYDAWDFLGYSAYVSSIWLAALKATKEMAQVLGDKAYARKMDEVYVKAQDNMGKLLWNGEYYNLWHDPSSGKTNYYCMADQLNGQWYANILKLGDIFGKDHVNSALKAIYKYNYRPEAGLLNGVLPERYQGKGAESVGGVAFVSDWHQRDNPWTGIEYAVASLLIQEGFVKEGLTIIKNVYDRYQQAGLTWNHIECGGHYYRAMDVWEILPDLGGLSYDAPKQELDFKPIVKEGEFRSVFVVPAAWGVVTQTREPTSQSNTIKVNEGNLAIKRLLLKTQFKKIDVKVQKGATKIVVKEVKNEKDFIELELKDTTDIKSGESLQIQINPL